MTPARTFVVQDVPTTLAAFGGLPLVPAPEPGDTPARLAEKEAASLDWLRTLAAVWADRKGLT